MTVKPLEKWVRAARHDLEERAAVAIAHASAVVWHACSWGLIDRRMTPSDWIAVGLVRIAAAHPALESLVDLDITPITGLTPEMSQELLAVWDGYKPSGDAVLDGHRLGELYQHLSAEARSRRALCQTPSWVTHLLLEISLRHAVAGSKGTLPPMMDPACGTGHILVETFLQLLRCLPDGDLAGKSAAAMFAVHGVDIDPYAVVLARYRILAITATLLKCMLDRLPADMSPQVTAANSLLDTHPLLAPAHYDLIVANPPYITCKDPATRDAIRTRYPEVCHGNYSLALPFHALMMRLLAPGGWCAQLTSNSFMKREFGKRYIEEWLPQFEMRWVIDTSGAYIPGHGTPTVIMVHRNQPPTATHVRCVQGVRGEPSRPKDPANGLVWSAIRNAVLAREARDREILPPPDAQPVPLVATAMPFQEALFDLTEMA